MVIPESAATLFNVWFLQQWGAAVLQMAQSNILKPGFQVIALETVDAVFLEGFKHLCVKLLVTKQEAGFYN